MIEEQNLLGSSFYLGQYREELSVLCLSLKKGLSTVSETREHSTTVLDSVPVLTDIKKTLLLQCFFFILTLLPHSTTSDTRCVGFVFFLTHTKQVYITSRRMSYNLTQFLHSLPGDSSRYHRWRAQAHRLPHRSDANLKVVGPQSYHDFCQTSLQIRDSHDLLPLRFDYLLEQFPELRKDLFTFIISLKDMVKATDEQSDKEIQRARIQSTGATAPVQLASIVLQLYGCVHQPGSSPNPAFLWRLHHIGMIDHYLHFQPLSPWWGWIPSFQSRFGLSDDQLSSRSPPRITSFIQKTLLSPRKFLEI